MSETMIGMILGLTMIDLDRNHSFHLIRKIIVQDDMLLSKLMRGEMRVKDV
jgi:hypothetical protein